MTGARITIEIDDKLILAKLDRVAAQGRDTGPAMDAIGAYMLTSTQQRFERETSPDGTPWQPLARRTVRERAKRGFVPVRILRRRGFLYQSLTFEASPSEAAVGTNNPYAGIHQFGGTIKREARRQTIYRTYNARTDELSRQFTARKRANFAQDVDVAAHEITIPARPYLGIDEADRAEIVAIIEDHLDGGPLAGGAA
ncbi:phage virion morphogenesis protein [Breoghania corrubedonensis]|uniref:Phage virion morphogenesis protein n=1 Tax=Breoghania corrubedonensis TaxID=665038 RepID=A0A2T5VCF6_9HYPH|nr:phage virion morphogenesis protein [Breoghania corrubedonensis]PTW61427.1 phage virion morphogenesis protein [Breoghania corrubedonensis]